VAYLTYKDFVDLIFLPEYQILAVLTHKKLEILSYKKNLTSSSLVFFIHYSIEIWNVQEILNLGVPKSNSRVDSFSLTLFD
jgi:hypothetical protein